VKESILSLLVCYVRKSYLDDLLGLGITCWVVTEWQWQAELFWWDLNKLPFIGKIEKIKITVMYTEIICHLYSIIDYQDFSCLFLLLNISCIQHNFLLVFCFTLEGLGKFYITPRKHHDLLKFIFIFNSR
jgi:hypothetical protein